MPQVDTQNCGYLKIIAILIDLQGWFTKYCWVLCLWDSLATEHTLIKKEWTKRTSFQPWASNIEHTPLIISEKVLPSFHIELGLMKIFARAMDKEDEEFKNLTLHRAQ